MSFIPTFELGFWNGWIFILPFFLLPFIGSYLIKKRKMESLSEYLSEFSIKLKIIMIMLVIPIYGSYFYSIFLPIELGTFWFFIGLVIFLVGLSIQIVAWHNLATTPADIVVTKGLYRNSRNPMYIGDFLVLVSIAIICLSWIFLLVSILSFILNYIAVISEERECLAKYGDSYKNYTDRIPRWIGKAKTENS